MIHDSSNFKLNTMFPSATNYDNTDDDIVGKITFNGKMFLYNNGQKLYMQTKSKKSSNNNYQKRIGINYINFNKANKIIVLLLESPSNDEYIGPRFRPANGKTGFRIDNQLIQLINKYINVCFPNLPQKGTTFDIAILNAVRYQCNLGNAGNRTIINSVFTQLWNKAGDPFSNDLLERINIISPSLIINACTKGNSNNKLCSTSFLKSNLNTRIVEVTNHPSTWSSKTIIF